jgi:branched-chain amino acid transport system substrate-binding protein
MPHKGGTAVNALYRTVAALVLTCSIALAASALAGAEGKVRASSQGQSPIVIGQVGGLTGFLQPFDTAVNAGMQLAIKDINARGGVLGRPLKLVSADMASDISKSVAAAQRVLGQGAVVVAVPSDFGPGAPVARFINGKKRIAIAFIGSAQFGYAGVGPLAYNFWQGTETESAALAEWAYRTKKIRHPFILTDVSNQYGKDNCAAFKARWNQLAGEDSIAGEDTFQNSDTNISSQVVNIKGADNVDAVMVCSFPPGGVTPIREMRAAGIDVPVLIGAGYEGNYWQSAVPNLSNVYGTAMRSIFETKSDRTLRRLAASYKNLTGSAPPTATFLAAGYSEIQALARAIRTAKSTDTAKIAAALNKFKNVSLIAGATTFTPTCHVAVGRPTLIVAYTGKSGKVIAKVRPQQVPLKKC